MEDREIKVLIVEDVRSTAMALRRVLSCFNVVGAAPTGREALERIVTHRPHVITMDINLPDWNGLDLTREILLRHSATIIVVSSLVTPEQQRLIFESLRSGAYEVIEKGRLFGPRGESPLQRKLVRIIRAAAHRKKPPLITRSWSAPAGVSPKPSGPLGSSRRYRLLAIGASTGGPVALGRLLSALPATFPLPIVIAQHMAEGFIEGLAQWLDSTTELTVELAQGGATPQPGRVYLPPSGHHIALARTGALVLTATDNASPCPSVDFLFSSAARAHGPAAIGLLLTGMGCDGAKGLLEARQRGALTLVQDEASSVVFGMPRAAIGLGAAMEVLPLSEIPPWLVQEVARAQDRDIQNSHQASRGSAP